MCFPSVPFCYTTFRHKGWNGISSPIRSRERKREWSTFVYFFKILLKLTLWQTLVGTRTHVIASPEITDSQGVYWIMFFFFFSKVQNVKWFDKGKHGWGVVRVHGRNTQPCFRYKICWLLIGLCSWNTFILLQNKPPRLIQSMKLFKVNSVIGQNRNSLSN